MKNITTASKNYEIKSVPNFYCTIDFILVSSLVVVALVGDAEALFAGPSDLGNVLTKLVLASGVGFAAS